MSLLMYDATPGGVDAIPEGAHVVAGYVDGNYVSYPAIVRRFNGKARCISIGIFLDAIADFADVEQGNPINTPEKVRASFEYRKRHGVWRPGFYGDIDHMHNVILPGLAGIPRDEYRLWLADWTFRIFLPAGYDACQFTDNRRPSGADGPYDTSVINRGTFLPPEHKRPAKKHSVPHPHKPSPRLPRPRPVVHRHPAAPKRKVVAATGGGGGGVALVELFKLLGVHISSAQAAEIATLLAFIVGYVVPEKP